MWRRLHFIFLLGALLSACGGVKAIYGVPEDRWRTLSEDEKKAAVAQFYEQEALNRQARELAEQARRQAVQDRDSIQRPCEEDEQEYSLQKRCKRRTLYRDWMTP